LNNLYTYMVKKMVMCTNTYNGSSPRHYPAMRTGRTQFIHSDGLNKSHKDGHLTQKHLSKRIEPSRTTVVIALCVNKQTTVSVSVLSYKYYSQIYTIIIRNTFILRDMIIQSDSIIIAFFSYLFTLAPSISQTQSKVVTGPWLHFWHFCSFLDDVLILF